MHPIHVAHVADRRWPGLRFPLAVVALALVAASCSAAGPSQPSSSPSDTVSAISTSEAASPTPPATSSSTTTPPPANAGEAVKYDCQKLITDAEMRAATGLSSAAFLSQELWTDTPGLPEGETYCQFFAGSISIAVSVLTGPAFDQVFQPLMAAGQDLPSISGLGDEALWSEQAASLGVRAGSTGLTIVFTNTGGGSVGMADPKGAGVTMATLVLSRL